MQGSDMAAVIISVFAAMVLIVGGDAAGKTLTAAGVSPGFVAWARFAIPALLFWPLARIRRHEIAVLADWRLWLRASLIAGGIACILKALSTAPMADVFAAFFVGPIVSFALSALLLGERVTVLRTALLAVSFAGVLIAVRPGLDMPQGIGWALLAGVLHGGYLVATRWLAPDFRPMLLLWSQLTIGALVLTPFAGSSLPEMSSQLIWLLIISAIASASGNLLLVLVNRTTPASTIAPLIYSQLVAATVIGWLVFAAWPDTQTLIGLVIIIVAGVGSAVAARKGR